MPGTDLPLEQLRQYTGSTPRPADFDAFWEKAQARVNALPLDVQLEPVDICNPQAAYYRVRVTATDGCVLQAKYIRPVSEAAVPAVLQWHDYPAAARGWLHLTRYPAMGWAVLAPDCRGQGGVSQAGRATVGPMAYGPLFNGLDGAVQQMYLYRLLEDALLWARVLQALPGLDADALAVYGEGQGGGLAVVCAALAPIFAKCGVHYPMLCDYKRVWDKDFDVGPYEGLRFFCRWYDPLGRRVEELFTKLGYVDAVYFAPWVQASVLLSTGLQDVVSPPSAQFAVFNKLQCPKRHLVYPKHGHELNNFFENAWMAFLLEQEQDAARG